jgi:hypothetical protein
MNMTASERTGGAAMFLRPDSDEAKSNLCPPYLVGNCKKGWQMEWTPCKLMDW